MAKPGLFKTSSLGGLIGGIGSIYTGIAAFRSSVELASDLRFEGEIIYRESIRTSAIIIEEGKKFAAGQSLQYIGSGVQLAGSVLVTLAQTRKYAATEAEATRARGAAYRTLAERKAARVKSEGRASLVSGIIGGVASVFL